MNNNFEKMMEQMMEKYMEQMMAKTMEKMFSSMMAPTVAAAEAVDVPAKQEKMTLEELLALDTSNEVAEKPSIIKGKVDFEVVDFKPRNARKYHKGLKYNQYVSRYVWTYNHLNIKKKYPNVKYSNGCYYCETLGELQQFANPNTGYHIVTNLTDEQMAEVKAYWESRKSK